MRPRNKKNLESRLDNVSSFLEDHPETRKGKWKKGYKALHVEVGCGKGSFLCGMAEKNPDIFFVGIEMVRNVICTACERAEEKNLTNLTFINGNARYMSDYFEDKEIDSIYLNFSDPWPRDKQSKHRLTSDKFLPLYVKLMVDNGRIVQKTDNRPLFDFSVEMYNEFNCKINKISYDLHNEAWYGDIGNVVTEYESRFVELGTPICYADINVPTRDSIADRIKECEEELKVRRMHEEEAIKVKGKK